MGDNPGGPECDTFMVPANLMNAERLLDPATKPIVTPDPINTEDNK